MPENEKDDAEEIRIVETDAAAETPAADSTQRRDDEHFRREARPQPRQTPKETSRQIPDDGDEDLGPRVQKRLNQFRRRTGDAEARATALAEENRRLAQQLQATSSNAFAHYEGAALARLETAKKEAQEAYESGDGQKVVEANRKLASAQVAIDNVEQQKAGRVAEEAQRQAAPQTPTKPVYSAKTQNWVDDNPWFESDAEAKRDAIRVHERLVREGFVPESDKYFAELSKRCAALFPEHFDGNDLDEDDEPQRKAEHRDVEERPARRAPPVAAASRERAPAGNQSARRVTEIKLTPAQMEAAQIAGVSPKAYGMSLMNLNKEGRR